MDFLFDLPAAVAVLPVEHIDTDSTPSLGGDVPIKPPPRLAVTGDIDIKPPPPPK